MANNTADPLFNTQYYLYHIKLMHTEDFNVLPCLQLMTYILLKCIIHTADLISITILNFTLHHFSPSSQKSKNTSIQLPVTEEELTHLPRLHGALSHILHLLLIVSLLKHQRIIYNLKPYIHWNVLLITSNKIHFNINYNK